MLLLFNNHYFQKTPLFGDYKEEWINKSTLISQLIIIWLWAVNLLKASFLYVPFLELISDFMTYSWSIGAIEITLGNLLSFLFIIWASLLISRFVRFIMEEGVLIQQPIGLRATASLVISYCLVAIGVFMALAAAGIGLDRISIFVGAFGVGIGFGLQNIANNLISGIILAAERPIQVEDIIEINSQLGVVKKIGFRSSIIRTYDGAEIIVPNGDLISQEVTNWTHTDKKRRIEILVGVAYGTDLQMVKELLENTISEHKQVLRQPTPLVFFNGFGDSSLDFRVLVWTHQIEHWVAIRSELSIAIDLAFKEKGIEIPFPQRDLHVRSGLKKSVSKKAPGKKAPTKRKDDKQQ
ncbi:mechanosensitive ion channel [Cytophagales bacterium RKSG123]|nr:mechanosensitive ion channel [Xanthovirga aplysinae]